MKYLVIALLLVTGCATKSTEEKINAAIKKCIKDYVKTEKVETIEVENLTYSLMPISKMHEIIKSGSNSDTTTKVYKVDYSFKVKTDKNSYSNPNSTTFLYEKDLTEVKADF